MSETSKPIVESYTKIPDSNVKNLTYSIEGIPRITESQTVNINLYSGSYLGQEKIVKTVQSPSVVTVVTAREPSIIREEPSIIKEEPSIIKEEPSKTVSQVGKETESVSEYYVNFPKNSCHSVSNEPEVEKSMDVRKQVTEINKQNACNRNMSDIDRRRMEAELKATEEIAKIKQSVVEKRLALELAYLDNANNQSKIPKNQQQQQQQQQMPQTQPLQQPQQQQQQQQQQQAVPMTCYNDLFSVEDIRTLEELALKKQMAIESSLAHELEILEHQNRILNSQRQPQQIPQGNMRVITLMNSQGQEVPHAEILPPLGYRVDQNYMTLDNRQLQQSESKKFNLSMRNPIPLEAKKSTLPNAPTTTTETMFMQEQRYMPINEPIINYQQPVQPMYIPNMVPTPKPMNFWKSTYMKLKNKIRPPKNPQPWE